MSKLPTVFVSSTCFDLSQVRHDMKQFIETIGYEPLLSEFDSFPIDPSQNTVENCIRAVETRADILILIIGGRYGFVLDNEKSITNVEYLTARSKGIPIYVFVQKNILALLPLWKEHPENNYSSVVDTPKLFDFVDNIRSNDSVWVYEFSSANDIIQTLKKQFAYLFYDSIQIRNKLTSVPSLNKYKDLSGKAIRLILEKPAAWEVRLFSLLLQEGINKYSDIRQDLIYNIIYGEGKSLSTIEEFLEWFPKQTDLLLRLVDSLNTLINDKLQIAFGEPGQHGDYEQIIYTTNRIVEGYRSSINWALDCKRIYVEEDLNKLIDMLPKFSEGIIKEIEAFSEKIELELNDALLRVKNGEKVELNLTMTLAAVGIDEFMDEVSSVVRGKYGFKGAFGEASKEA
ncbi:DUF4062 domain-containing protein [Paenibacillus barengoltzii]|uniref:DUF4062 domain-containing protein n=1 Tax=Paenibacillus barengoltzii TaxID=343517 RepID=UPI002FDA714C